jgi:hypothetical protein
VHDVLAKGLIYHMSALVLPGVLGYAMFLVSSWWGVLRLLGIRSCWHTTHFIEVFNKGLTKSICIKTQSHCATPEKEGHMHLFDAEAGVSSSILKKHA